MTFEGYSSGLSSASVARTAKGTYTFEVNLKFILSDKRSLRKHLDYLIFAKQYLEKALDGAEPSEAMKAEIEDVKSKLEKAE